MTSILKHWRAVGVGACCAAAGVGAGTVATAGASTSGAGSSAATAAHHQRSHPRAARRALRGSVHGSAVVHTKSGFRTITWDRGTVSSVHGDQITLAEGTRTATYKTVTLTVPSDARIRDNGAKAMLASIKAGQRAIVVQGPKRTLVVAHTPKARHTT